jgi:hypothetical protein
MKFQGAVIKEQGVTFAVVVVKMSVIDNRIEANKLYRASNRFFRVFLSSLWHKISEVGQSIMVAEI